MDDALDGSPKMRLWIFHRKATAEGKDGLDRIGRTLGSLLERLQTYLLAGGSGQVDG